MSELTKNTTKSYKPYEAWDPWGTHWHIFHLNRPVISLQKAQNGVISKWIWTQKFSSSSYIMFFVLISQHFLIAIELLPIKVSLPWKKILYSAYHFFHDYHIITYSGDIPLRVNTPFSGYRDTAPLGPSNFQNVHMIKFKIRFRKERVNV